MTDKTAMIPMEKNARLFSFDWKGFDVLETFSALSHLPYSIFLDSSRTTHPLSCQSFILWDPFETISAKDGVVRVINKDNKFEFKSDPFRVVRERLGLWSEIFDSKKSFSSFNGGACGYFGYDLARGLETLPNHAQSHSQPDLNIGLYSKWIAFDHKSKKSKLFVYSDTENCALVQKKMLEESVFNAIAPSLQHFTSDWKTQKSDTEFLSDIQKSIDYILAGDIFQVNLSRRFSAQTPDKFNPFLHYMHLRNINPAPYGAFMNFDDVQLASCSPERFLSSNKRVIETRPIKGTLPSNFSTKQLEDSTKDRAENIMIVDLLRNDLSKVCEDHSVLVDKLCDIETFEGLHHMVSTVRGTLRANQTPMDALRACFPGGSVTGAPKVRAMEIIDELEPNRRGAYCGAMGYIGFDGTMDTAITIRTLVYTDGEVHLQTGGGITALSLADLELDETLTKAEKLFESFDAEALTDRKIA